MTVLVVAAFVAAYSARPGTGVSAEIDAMLRIPPPSDRIARTAAAEPAMVPRRFTSRIVVSSCSGWVQQSPANSTPALFTHTASGPRS